MADRNETTLPSCQWLRQGAWCFRRLNDEVRAAEARMQPGQGTAADEKPPTLPDLLQQIASMDLPAENILCECVQGRRCPFGESEGSGLISHGANMSASAAATSPNPETVPRWDAEKRVLKFGGKIVKQFRKPALNQEIILAAFEEEGWPERIDDPIRPNGEITPKQRLHFTIWRLNRKQKHELLAFSGDGTGQGICWSRVAEGLPSHDDVSTLSCGKRRYFEPEN